MRSDVAGPRSMRSRLGEHPRPKVGRVARLSGEPIDLDDFSPRDPSPPDMPPAVGEVVDGWRSFISYHVDGPAIMVVAEGGLVSVTASGGPGSDLWSPCRTELQRGVAGVRAQSRDLAAARHGPFVWLSLKHSGDEQHRATVAAALADVDPGLVRRRDAWCPAQLGVSPRCGCAALHEATPVDDARSWLVLAAFRALQAVVDRLSGRRALVL